MTNAGLAVVLHRGDDRARDLLQAVVTSLIIEGVFERFRT